MEQVVARQLERRFARVPVAVDEVIIIFVFVLVLVEEGLAEDTIYHAREIALGFFG
jgi:hypothetical protein